MYGTRKCLSDRTAIAAGWTQGIRLLRIACKIRISIFVAVQIFLKVKELPHEGEIRRNIRLAALDVVVCLVQAHVLTTHQVGHSHSY